MPPPRRSTQLSELSDEMVWCHAFGHYWDDPPITETTFLIGKERQQRQDHTCENGCGNTKGHYIDPTTGERWGWKRGVPDDYGIDGGFTRADFVAEWFRRVGAGAAKPVPLPFQRRNRMRKRKRSNDA